MEERQPSSPSPSWQAGIDQTLVRRLAQPMALAQTRAPIAQTVLRRVERMINRLPLVDEMSQRAARGDQPGGAGVPIVYPRPQPWTRLAMRAPAGSGGAQAMPAGGPSAGEVPVVQAKDAEAAPTAGPSPLPLAPSEAGTIDAGLAQHLAQPMALAQTRAPIAQAVVQRVEGMINRLPLVDEMSQRVAGGDPPGGASVPITYAQPQPSAQPPLPEPAPRASASAGPSSRQTPVVQAKLRAASPPDLAAQRRSDARPVVRPSSAPPADTLPMGGPPSRPRPSSPTGTGAGETAPPAVTHRPEARPPDATPLAPRRVQRAANAAASDSEGRAPGTETPRPTVTDGPLPVVTPTPPSVTHRPEARPPDATPLAPRRVQRAPDAAASDSEGRAPEAETPRPTVTGGPLPVVAPTPPTGTGAGETTPPSVTPRPEARPPGATPLAARRVQRAAGAAAVDSEGRAPGTETPRPMVTGGPLPVVGPTPSIGARSGLASSTGGSLPLVAPTPAPLGPARPGSALGGSVSDARSTPSLAARSPAPARSVDLPLPRLAVLAGPANGHISRMLARSGGDGVIQRVDDGMPGTTGSPPPATFNASAPAAPATAATNDDEGETDVEDMVDRVMRKLMRRLAIASERKGLTRWTS